MSGRQVVIYEPNHGGHRLKFVALLLETYLATHRVVVATTREALESAEYRELLAKHEPHFELQLVPSRNVYSNSPCSRLTDAWLLARYLGTLAGAELVLIPYLDSVFFPFGLAGVLNLVHGRRRPQLHGILLRGDYAYQEGPPSWRTRLKNLLAVRIVATGPFHRISCLDQLLFAHLMRHANPAAGRLSYCPDPVEKVAYDTLQADFRARHGIAREAKVIGAFGSIEERKGIDLLLRAFVAYQPAEHEFLLLVGKHSAGVKRVLKELRGSHPQAHNIICVDSFVSDSEMLSAIQASDTVATLYPGHIGSASIVIRAAAMKKPVIGTDFGWIGRSIRENGLGHCFDVRDQAQLVRAITWCFTAARMDPFKAERFAAHHSVANFSRAILDAP